MRLPGLPRLPRWWSLALTLVLYAGLHVPRLDAPALGFDSWREADGLMVARAFCTERPGIFSPRVGQRGDTDGATGMEFPLLNWIVGKLGCASGDFEWWGRLVVLPLALAGIAAFWALLTEAVGLEWGAIATPLYAFSPLVFYYGRSFQPDVPAITFALAGLLVLQRGCSRGLRPWMLLPAAVSLSIALLIKLPAIVFLLPAAGLLLAAEPLSRLVRRPALWAAAALVMLPAACWYHHARQLEAATGLTPFHVTRSPWDLPGEVATVSFWRSIFGQYLFDLYLFPIASVAAVAAPLLYRSRLPRLVATLGVAAFAFFLLGGASAAHHGYYGVMAVPALAALAAGAAIELERRSPTAGRALIVLLLGASVPYAWHRTRGWFATPADRDAVASALVPVDALLPPTAGAVLFSEVDPTMLYQVGRTGWIAPPVDPAGWFVAGGPRPPLALIDRKRIHPPLLEEVRQALRSTGYVSVVEHGRLEAWLLDDAGSTPRRSHPADGG